MRHHPFYCCRKDFSNKIMSRAFTYSDDGYGNGNDNVNDSKNKDDDIKKVVALRGEILWIVNVLTVWICACVCVCVRLLFDLLVSVFLFMHLIQSSSGVLLTNKRDKYTHNIYVSIGWCTHTLASIYICMCVHKIMAFRCERRSLSVYV